LVSKMQAGNKFVVHALLQIRCADIEEIKA
jgi:hypothetical protein